MKSPLTPVSLMEKPRLKRVLGIFDLFALGYGDLGSSIYYALGVTALFALGATPIALFLGGVVFICTALTYAEMTSMFHESGGSASFARYAFNDLISFIAGWGLLLDYVVTIAISAFAVAPYLSHFYPALQEVPIHLGATVLLIAVLLIINLFGIRQSSRISLFFTSLTVLTQLAIVVIAAFFLFNLSYVLEHMKIAVPGVSWSPSWEDFWKGTAMAMVAYTGIESIAQLGCEAKTPSKTVPRAILLTMSVLIFVYIGISFVAFSAIPPQELGTKYLENPLAGIVAYLPGGTFLSPWLAIVAAALLFVAANAGLVGSSRLAFNLGEYYQLPRYFHHVHPTSRVPSVSLLIFAFLAILVVLASRGKMMFLADLYNFGAMIAFFSAHLALIVMRIKRPEQKRPFYIPFNVRIMGYEIPITAIIGCLATLSVWLVVVYTKPEGRYFGFLWILSGVVMYFLYRRRKKIDWAASVRIEKVKVPAIKPLILKNILVLTRGTTHIETVYMACELAQFHGAKLTAMHIVDLPPSLPADVFLAPRLEQAKAALKQAEAIAREFNVEVETEVVRARSILAATLEVIERKHIDLLILGTRKRGTIYREMGPLAKVLLQKAPCKVWVCADTVSK